MKLLTAQTASPSRAPLDLPSPPRSGRGIKGEVSPHFVPSLPFKVQSSTFKAQSLALHRQLETRNSDVPRLSSPRCRLRCRSPRELCLALCKADEFTVG